MGNLDPKWRGFWGHLGMYIIVIGTLGLINLSSGSGELWFLWPALGWGAAVAFHLWGILLASMKDMTPKWRRFLGHLGSYLIVISMLGMMNLLSSSGELWFLWPAQIWGAVLAIHLLGVFLSTGRAEEEKRERREERQEPHLQQDEAESKPSSTPRRRKKEPRPRPVEYPLINKGQTNPSIQGHLDKALAYQAQIESLIKATPDVNARTRLQDLAGEVGEWVEAIEDLTRRINDFQGNSLIRQDLESVPQAITSLEAQIANETDSGIRTQLERTLANRRNQLASLERLQTTMKRAEIQIESTLSALGTIYSQLLTGESTDHVADYSRLSAEVDEEVQLLQDRLEALEEVKLGRM
jgi:hypothetical protein